MIRLNYLSYSYSHVKVIIINYFWNTEYGLSSILNHLIKVKKSEMLVKILNNGTVVVPLCQPTSNFYKFFWKSKIMRKQNN